MCRDDQSEMLLIDLLERVDVVYAKTLGSGRAAYMLPAAITLLHVDQAAPADAPTEFHELAILALFLSDGSAISDPPVEFSATARALAAENLLKLVAAAHPAGVMLQDDRDDCFGPAR